MTRAAARRVGRLALAGAAAALAVAAAGYGATAPTPAAAARHPAAAPHATPPPVPAGYRVHRSTEAGVSLALPRGWQALAGADARSPGAIQTLSGVHRAFLPYLLELAAPDSPLKLFAFDPASSRRHPSIATVQEVTRMPPGAFQRWLPQTLRSLEGLKTRRGPLAWRRVELPAGTALRVEFRRSDGDRVLIYVVPSRSGLWAVTFAAPPRAAGWKSFDRAAATFAPAPRGGPKPDAGPAAPAS